MDVGSRNGTLVNQNRLYPQEQIVLGDGDVIEFSHIRVELFISGWQERAIARQDTEV
jgi:pSer/pThr/pTyr-binding forkhead associated (FHA) protein